MKRKTILMMGIGCLGMLMLVIGGVILAILASKSVISLGGNPSGGSGGASSGVGGGIASGSDVDPASGGYMFLASQGSGRTLFVQRPKVGTVSDAVLATLRDMTHILDSKPTPRGAFADSSQHRGGGSFTGTLNGQAVRGMIMCGIDEKGAAVTVIYDRADAPANEWAALTAALPADVRMKSHPFGNGVGTIDFPSDWSFASASDLGSVQLKGRGRESVAMGIGTSVITPDSPAAMMQEQVRQLGQLTPAGTVLVAPFTGPVDALRNLTPQLSVFVQSQGGMAFRLEKVLESQAIAAQFPNGQAARIKYLETETENGKDYRMLNYAEIETYPLGPGGWAMLCNFASAAESTFDAEMPVMLSIGKSWKLDQQVLAAHSQQSIAASNQQFAGFERSMQERNDAFDSYLATIQRDSLIAERSSADFDEVMIGYRTVLDTNLDHSFSVDLGNVNTIVDALNRIDPDRYVQIPLRDEEFPLPEPGH